MLTKEMVEKTVTPLKAKDNTTRKLTDSTDQSL